MFKKNGITKEIMDTLYGGSRWWVEGFGDNLTEDELINIANPNNFGGRVERKGTLKNGVRYAVLVVYTD